MAVFSRGSFVERIAWSLLRLVLTSLGMKIHDLFIVFGFSGVNVVPRCQSNPSTVM